MAERADEPLRVLDVAKYRYLNDPVFHAKVEMTLQVMFATHDLDPESDHGLVITSAAVAMVLAKESISGVDYPAQPAPLGPEKEVT